MSKTKECGCQVVYEPAQWPKVGKHRIQYCVMHEAAAEMLEALRGIASYCKRQAQADSVEVTLWLQVQNKARVAVYRAEDRI